MKFLPYSVSLCGSICHDDRPISSDRRTEILEAAIRVLARDGLAQASTRKLAAEAGINQATLLYSRRQQG